MLVNTTQIIDLGVALAGGSVRGAAHLGIIQAFQEVGIDPDIYAGTSAGSIVAALLAYGYPPKYVLQEFKSLGSSLFDIAYGHILQGIFTKSYVEGIFKGNKLEKFLLNLTDFQYLADIDTPLAIATTDINTGEEIIFANHIAYPASKYDPKLFDQTIQAPYYQLNNGAHAQIGSIVRASCSLPGVFIPKKIVGHRLVDGGITNNLPSDLCKLMGANKVISIDLGYSGRVETKGIFDILHTSLDILMDRPTGDNKDDFGLYLNPEIYDIGSLDVDKMQEIFDRGYEYGKSVLPIVKHYLGMVG